MVVLVTHPEMRAMPNGEAVTTLSVATSESWSDKKKLGKLEHEKQKTLNQINQLLNEEKA